MLSKKAIQEYQEIYKAEHGKDLSYQKAVEGATKLLRLFKLIYHPLPKKWLEQIEKSKGGGKNGT